MKLLLFTFVSLCALQMVRPQECTSPTGVCKTPPSLKEVENCLYKCKEFFALGPVPFCGCVEAQFPTCMGCLADLEPFYRESTAVYSTLATCPRMRDLYKNTKTFAQLDPIWDEQCSRCGTNGWLYKDYSSGESLCICNKGYAGFNCTIERSPSYCGSEEFVGGCIDSGVKPPCDGLLLCHSANGVCTTRALATVLCPTRIWTSFSYDPNSCYTRSCVTTCLLPDVQTTRRKEEIVSTNTGFLCSDGQCVADASLCEQEEESSTIVTALETDLSSLDLSYRTLLPLTNIDTGSLIGRVEFEENTFAVGTRLTVEPTSFTTLAELLGEDGESFAEKIVSAVVTLRARDLTSGEELGEKGFLSPVRIVLAPVRAVNVTDVCIAYLNVTLKEWICLENTTIASVEPLLLTAVTPHFTDFSVILTGSPSDGGGGGDGEDGVEDGYGYTDGDDGYNADGDGNADDGGNNDDIGALDDAAKTEEGGDEEWMAPVLGGVVGGVVLLVMVFAAGVAVVWYVRKAKLRREGGSNVVNFDDDLELSD